MSIEKEKGSSYFNNHFFKEYSNIHTPTIKIKNGGLIEFSQSNVNSEITSGKLHNIKIQYNGLCEIICNYVLLEDMLGEGNLLPLHHDVLANWSTDEADGHRLNLKFRDNTDFLEKYRNKYGDKITVANLKKVENTHILNITNFFTQLLALLFSIYPCNLFSTGLTKNSSRQKDSVVH